MTTYICDEWTRQYDPQIRPRAEPSEGDTVRIPADRSADGREWADLSHVLTERGLGLEFDELSDDERWELWTVVPGGSMSKEAILDAWRAVRADGAPLRTIRLTYRCAHPGRQRCVLVIRADRLKWGTSALDGGRLPQYALEGAMCRHEAGFRLEEVRRMTLAEDVYHGSVR